LDRFRAVRSTRVVESLHIEGIERIQIDSEVHLLGDWKYLEERKIHGPIDGSRNEGFYEKRIPRWTR
jgi:hypothetical protein